MLKTIVARRVNTDFAIFLLSAVGLWAGMFVYSVSKDVQADFDIISIYTVYESDIDALERSGR